MISGSTEPIFTKFSLYGKHLAQGTLPWQPILRSQLAQSNYSPLFAALAFGNSDFKKFIYVDLVTLCVNLVNFGLVPLEFSKVKDVRPVVSFLKYTFPTNYLKPIFNKFHQMVDNRS